MAVPGKKVAIPRTPVELIPRIRSAALDLLARDSRNMVRGVYPASVLLPEGPRSHFGRLPRVLVDGLRISWRRSRGRTTEFNAESRDYLAELPRYYRRNFHFQSNGYLTQESAELYEHQVEMLFGGTADAMRRLLLEPMKDRLGTGEGIRILELGAGTGRMTRFLAQTFPKARITAVDLSTPYLQVARSRLSGFPRVGFLQADAGELPFAEGKFDAVVSVFLFHELPFEARRAVVNESLRVVKNGGFVGMVDSMQQGDDSDLAPIMEIFPAFFHEPFYRNYTENPMEQVFGEAGAVEVASRVGLFSKALWGVKPEAGEKAEPKR
jgi:ubiquinone/menaquinone biosynthesis C-methylase UbiE